MQVKTEISSSLPDFWVPFWAIPGFLDIIFLVKFDLFKNNPYFWALILILPVRFNPILTGFLNTCQNRGAHFTPPPNSLVFYPRSIKFGT